MVKGVLSNVPGVFLNIIKFAASRKFRRNFHKHFPVRNSQIRKGYRPGSRNLSCMGQLRTLTRSLIGGRVILGGRKCHSIGWDVLRRNHWNIFFEENGATVSINSERYIGVTGEVLHRAPGPLSKLYEAPVVPARWCYPPQLT